MSDLLEYRSAFPILEHTTYLINHSLAAMPRRAEERLAEYARMWKERGIRSWGEGWWTMPITVGDQVGRIVGAPPGTTVMHQNVAIAEAVVLSCFFPIDAARNRVVYERGELPVRSLPLPGPTRSRGRRLRRRRARSSRRSTSARCSSRSATCCSRRARSRTIEPIIRRAHEVGAHVILDCYQSAGIVPFDVTALEVDFAVGGSVKWLCGGPGNGWLYVRPDLAERLEPTYTGWQAHERPFGFEEEMDYAPGAARFLTGTPNVPAHYAATAGYDLIEEIGVDRIRENSLRQTQLLIDLADAAGFGVRSPRDRDAARRHRHRARARVPGRVPGADGAADPLRLPPRCRHPPRAALLQHRRRAALRDRADRRDRRERRLRAAPRRRRAHIDRSRVTTLSRPLAGFMLGAAGMFATMYSTQAILPELSSDFDVSPSRAGLSVSVVVLAVALGGWVWGPVSDRIGRTRAIRLASLLLVAPTIGVAIAPTFAVLLACRALQGLCMPGLLAVAAPYVVEAFVPRIGARAMGYYVSSLVAGGLVGRLGVALASGVVGWRWAIGALALFPFAAAIAMRGSLPEPPPPVRGDGAAAPSLNRRLLGVAIAGGALFFTFVGTFTYVTYRLEEPPFSYSLSVASLVFLLWLTGLAPARGSLRGPSRLAAPRPRR